MTANPIQYVATLRSVRLDNVFNPYSDRCSVHDFPDAPYRRGQALQALLEAAVESNIDSIWIGRDLGYRGGRRTGLALTDDVHLVDHGQRWGVVVERPTSGEQVAERTASVVWGVLSKIPEHVFLWNVFPFHPHEPDTPFTNRAHNSSERRVGETLLVDLVRLLRPRRIVAIGGDAAKAAQHLKLGHEVLQVRHPSYGGRSEFISQICSLYGLR